MVESIVYGIDHLHQVSLTDSRFATKYQRVYARAVTKRAESFPQLVDSLSFLQNFENKDITSLEIFGAWEEFCIAEGIAEALSYGINVRVPKGYVAALKERKMSFSELVSLKLGGGSFRYDEDEEYHYFTP